jgi:transcriptional regulator with GAF, ATPase, and Fis domain
MPDYQEISRRLVAIHQAVDEAGTLDRVLTFALTAVTCDMAGVIISANGTLTSTAVTAQAVRASDHLQFALDEGPGLAAIRATSTVVVDDADGDERWPRWGARAAQLGIHSVLSTPMRDNANTVGSLNLYAERVAAFDAEDSEVTVILAHHATAAYLTSSKASAAVRAIDTRTSIGQAQGILMERYDIDAARSFSVLRRYSQQNNVAVRDIALALIQSRALPDLDPILDEVDVTVVPEVTAVTDVIEDGGTPVLTVDDV